MNFQEEMENLAYVNGSKQSAPTAYDGFYLKKVSYDLPKVRILRIGFVSFAFWLPKQVKRTFTKGFAFGVSGQETF